MIYTKSYQLFVLFCISCTFSTYTMEKRWEKLKRFMGLTPQETTVLNPLHKDFQKNKATLDKRKSRSLTTATTTKVDKSKEPNTKEEVVQEYRRSNTISESPTSSSTKSALLQRKKSAPNLLYIPRYLDAILEQKVINISDINEEVITSVNLNARDKNGNTVLMRLAKQITQPDTIIFSTEQEQILNKIEAFKTIIRLSKKLAEEDPQCAIDWNIKDAHNQTLVAFLESESKQKKNVFWLLTYVNQNIPGKATNERRKKHQSEGMSKTLMLTSEEKVTELFTNQEVIL